MGTLFKFRIQLIMQVLHLILIEEILLHVVEENEILQVNGLGYTMIII